MQFHTTQSLVAKDDTQYRIVDCGRQWGKTTLAVWEMTACAYAKKGRRVAYFATTFGQARDIAWAMLKEITRPVWAKPPNESRLELYINTQDKGISEIFLKGFESVETARGQQFDLLVLDEVSKMNNFKEGWEGALLGTLAFRKGKALFISTPYGFNHFHTLYELGQSDNPLYKSWRFTSFDNPHLPKDYLESIQTTVTEDFWAQEYLADFRRFTGLIYKEFDIAKHVHDFPTDLNMPGEYLFGQDFGVRGWNAMVACRVDSEGNLWIFDNFKQEGLTAIDAATQEKQILKKYADLEKYTGYADPAGWANNLGSIVTGQQETKSMQSMQWAIASEFIEAGLPIVPANNRVVSGINYVRQLFKAGKIHIHPRCTALIDELVQYQWKSPSMSSLGEEDDPEKVRKINDHLVDAFRYMLYSKPEAAEVVDEPRSTVFPAKFPLKFEVPEELGDKFTEIETSSIYD